MRRGIVCIAALCIFYVNKSAPSGRVCAGRPIGSVDQAKMAPVPHVMMHEYIIEIGAWNTYNDLFYSYGSCPQVE